MPTSVPWAPSSWKDSKPEQRRRPEEGSEISGPPPLAAQDSLERITVQIAEHDLEAAYHFVDAVEASLSLLSEMPEAGPRYETENVELSGRIRKWVIPRYRRYLLFYLFEKGIVHLIDVIDGRTDYDIEDSP